MGLFHDSPKSTKKWELVWFLSITQPIAKVDSSNKQISSECPGASWAAIMTVKVLSPAVSALATFSSTIILAAAAATSVFDTPQAIDTTNGVSIGVHVKFVFIGFNGEGNAGLVVEASELLQWVRAIDNLLPVTHLDHIRNDMQVPQVHLDVSCDVSILPPKVTTTVERFIKAYSSPVVPLANNSLQHFQVDWIKLEPVFDSLADKLGREAKNFREDFTFFVMNPKRNAKIPRYGYYVGPSAQEYSLVLSNETLHSKLVDAARAFPRVGKSKFAFDTKRPPDKNYAARYSRPPKFRASDTWDEGEEWAYSVRKILDAAENQAAQRPWHSQGKRPDEINLEDSIWEHLESEFIDYIGDPRLGPGISLTLSASDRNKSSMKFGGCLSDWMLGLDRKYAVLDITAGPFVFGIDSYGRSSNHNKPFAAVPSVEEILLHDNIGIAEVTPNETAQHEASVFLEQLTERRMSDGTGGTEAELLTAELDVYRMFVDEHCKKVNSGATDEVCHKVKERTSGVLARLAELHRIHEQSQSPEYENNGDPFPISREQRKAWALSIFGSDVGSILTPADQTVRVHDALLSRLGATLSHAVSETVFPGFKTRMGLALNPFRPKIGDPNGKPDRIPMIPKLIRIEVYEVESPSVGVAGLTVTSVLQVELRKILVPGQRLQVARHQVALEEDAALAIAVSRARSLSVSREKGLVLDASMLLEQLVSSSSHRPLLSVSPAQQEITINVFIIGTDGPNPRLAASGDLVEAFVHSGAVVAVSTREGNNRYADSVRERKFMCDGPEDVAGSATLGVIKGVISSCVSLISGLNIGFIHPADQDCTWNEPKAGVREEAGVDPSLLAAASSVLSPCSPNVVVLPAIQADTIRRMWLAGILESLSYHSYNLEKAITKAFLPVEGVAAGEREKKIRLRLRSMEKAMMNAGAAIGSAQWEPAVEHLDSIGRTLVKVEEEMAEIDEERLRIACVKRGAAAALAFHAFSVLRGAREDFSGPLKQHHPVPLTALITILSTAVSAYVNLLDT